MALYKNNQKVFQRLIFIFCYHGTRDIPIRKPYIQLTKNVQLLGDCYGKASGIDSLFIPLRDILFNKKYCCIKYFNTKQLFVMLFTIDI